jgi:acetyl-CoA acetyltransferase
VAGARTPFGKYGGSLSHLRLDDLFGLSMVAACERSEVSLDQVDDIAAGCVNTAHEGMGDVARWAALAAGFPESVPAITMNRFCASSLSAAIGLAHAVEVGAVKVGLAAGVESMSRSGWAFMKAEAPFAPRGQQVMLDTLWSGAGGPAHPELLRRHAYVSMIETAQNVADLHGLTRQEIDAFAWRSHNHAARARDSGRLAKEIVPVTIPATRQTVERMFEHDETIRDDTHPCLVGRPARPAGHDADDRRQLHPSVGRVECRGHRQRRHRVQARGDPAGQDRRLGAPRIGAGFDGHRAAVGDDQGHQGCRFAPEEIGVWEVHEAFAAQALGVLRELSTQFGGFEVPDDRLNPNGGAVAVGHPFGASGTRYLLTLALSMREHHARYGVLGVCAGSGQGVAILLESDQA